MDELLEVFEDLILAILDLVEFIMVFLAQLIASGIDSFFHGITKKLHIPFISWVYKKIAGNPLSILDVFSLIVSIPIHIVYVFEDKKFGKDEEKIINNMFDSQTNIVSSISELNALSIDVSALSIHAIDNQNNGSTPKDEDFSDSLKLLNTIMIVTAVITGIFKSLSDILQGEKNMESMQESSQTPGKRIPGPARPGASEEEKMENILEILASVTSLGLTNMWYAVRVWKEGAKTAELFDSSNNFTEKATLIAKIIGAVIQIGLIANKSTKIDEVSYGRMPNSMTDRLRKRSKNKKYYDSSVTDEAEKAKQKEAFNERVSEILTIPRMNTALGVIVSIFGAIGCKDPSFIHGAAANDWDKDRKDKLKKQLQFEKIAMLLLSQPQTFAVLQDGKFAESTEGVSPLVLGGIDAIAYATAVILHATKGYGSDL